MPVISIKICCFYTWKPYRMASVRRHFSHHLYLIWNSGRRKIGLTPWAPMYHIYHHSIPGDVSEWVKERASNENRIGRIAFLKPEKLFSYTYWHYAIVQEGLLKGDKYQYISLHENVLFFRILEEPRHNVNITGKRGRIKVIDGWMAVDPESHFDREKACGNNFLVIDPIMIV